MRGMTVARIGNCQVGEGAQAAHEAPHKHGEIGVGGLAAREREYE